MLMAVSYCSTSSSSSVSYVDILDRCNLIQFPPSSLPFSPNPSCHLQQCCFSRNATMSFCKLGFFSSRSSCRDNVRISRRIFRTSRRWFVTAVAGAGADHIGSNDSKIQQEANKGNDVPVIEDDLVLERQRKASQLQKRILFGVGIGISSGGVVLAGGWIFTVAIAAVAFAGAREYFALVRSRGIASGMTPPPRYVSQVCSFVCALMPIYTLYFGQIDVSVTSAAFVVAIALLLQRGSPRFAQLSSAIFGLFYCGYLPCFWVKLRCGLVAPALNSKVGASWPVLLGGQTHWTVGLVATLIAISSVIAADTFAFAGGKAFGRTPLTHISPKKTWEGAIAGLSGCTLTTVLLAKILCWPRSLVSAIAYGVLIFAGSLFGDLIESVIKRDAGVKDSGSLIPGHGGMLDRVDSYVFTGALAHSFVKTFLRLYGV